jgi:hypothetical protein
MASEGGMKWLKRDAWHIDSDCGRYRVNKALVSGEAVYQAVRLGNPPVIVLGRGSLAEAKQACEGRE